MDAMMRRNQVQNEAMISQSIFIKIKPFFQIEMDHFETEITQTELFCWPVRKCKFVIN